MSGMAWRYGEGWRWDTEWHPRPPLRTITLVEQPAGKATSSVPFGFGIRKPKAEWYGNPS
jgi:hypothetical protein